jgi:hypothetical protein
MMIFLLATYPWLFGGNRRLPIKVAATIFGLSPDRGWGRVGNKVGIPVGAHAFFDSRAYSRPGLMGAGI